MSHQLGIRLGVYVLAATFFLATFLFGQWIGRNYFVAAEGCTYWLIVVAVCVFGFVASFAEREFVWNRLFGSQRGRLDPGPLSLGLFGGLLVGLLRFQGV